MVGGLSDPDLWLLTKVGPRENALDVPANRRSAVSGPGDDVCGEPIEARLGPEAGTTCSRMISRGDSSQWRRRKPSRRRGGA